MSYAIVDIAGHQYRVQPGQTLTVPGLVKKPGDVITAKEVLLIHNGQVELGKPYLSTPVTFKVLKLVAGDKLKVATYKSKSRYRKTKGYRDQLTEIEVQSIGPEKPAKKS